jgi:hypothetical protein
MRQIFLDTNNKWWFPAGWIALVVVVAALVTSVILEHQRASPSVSTTTSTASSTAPPVIYVPANVLPNGLPADLPVEKNPAVMQNYQSNDPTLAMQNSVYEYATQLSPEQVYQNYLNYFETHNWQIIYSFDQPSLKAVQAKQAGVNSITVTIGSNSVIKQNVVNITAGYLAMSFSTAP